MFFFGNSKLFNIIGGKGSDSWLAKLSRKWKASFIMFYGRCVRSAHLLPQCRVIEVLVPISRRDQPTLCTDCCNVM